MDIGDLRVSFPSGLAPRLTGGQLPRDRVDKRPASAVVPTRPQVARAEPDIPDARAIASDPNLRYVDLNRAITGSYVQFSRLFQQIVDPRFDGGSQAAPTWYGIGAYASRGAGRGMMAAGVARSVLDRLLSNSDNPEEDVLRAALPALSVDDAKSLGDDVRSQFFSKKERVAATFLIAYALALRDDLSRVVRDGLLDPRILVISVRRLVSLVQGADLKAQMLTIADTMRNGLEDGNRRIFSDIGVNAQSYLEFRRTGPAPSPEDVLQKFVLSDQPQQAREMYRYASDCIASDGPLPTDLAARFPTDRYDSRNTLACGFALYEMARLTADPARKSRTIAFANNLLAYREQYVAAQPAFTPGQTLPGEVDRVPLWQMLTPAVDIGLRFGTWSYTRFAAEHLPRRDGSILTPRVCEYNWAAYDDRWPGIMNAFDTVNEHAAAMWPMPNPDPASRP